MKTLNISISDLEYDQLGIKGDKFSFTDFVDIINRELSRQNLRKSVRLAEKHGLSKMSMEDISAEVKAVRKRVKDNN